MTEQDHRDQLATYGQVIRHNPDAQKRHKAYVDLYHQDAQQGLGRSTSGEDTSKPVAEHRDALVEAGKALAAGKITPQEFAELNAKGMKHSKEGSKGKIAAAELTPEEQKVKGVDPSYNPKRPGVSGKAEASSEKDLTSLAQGKMPTHMIPDSEEDGASEDQAKEMMGGRGADDERAVSGSITQLPSPIALINEHPGFKAYLKLKEHLMSHYKDPAVRKYMEDKVNLHENNPNLDVDKLAATFHFLHRSRTQAERAASGQKKLMGDIAGGQAAPEAPTATEEAPGKGTALSPESMMTPEQTGRLQQVRQEKGTGPAPVKDVSAAVTAKPTGLKTDEPSYKAKIMAEIQAREDAKKPK